MSESPFSAEPSWKAATRDAASAPEAGMGFHEMFSWWVFVTAVTEHTVEVVSGGGHPSWFPECGTAKVIPRVDLPHFVRFAEVVEDKRYPTSGWAACAEGLTLRQLKDRINRGGKRAGRPESEVVE